MGRERFSINQKLRFILVFLAVLIIGLSFVYITKLNALKSCRKELVMDRMGNKKIAICGLVKKAEKYNYYLGIINNVYLENGLVKLQVKSANNGKIFDDSLTLGKINESYTFITIQKDNTFYSFSDVSKNKTSLLTAEFINKLKPFINKYFVFSIYNENSILNVDNSGVNDKYKNDLLFRKKYTTNCFPNNKNTDLRTIKDKCGYIYVHGLTLFSKDLNF